MVVGSEGHCLFIPPGIFKVRLFQIVFAPAKCYTWQLQNHPIPMSKYNAFLQAVQFCLLHHVGISLFQVDVQDRHHVVSLRRPAVRPQVWLLDLLWLAGWLWQRVPLILFKFIPFLRIYFHRIGCQTFCVSLIQDKKIQYQYPSFYFASKHGPAHWIYNPSSNSIGIQYNTLHNGLFVKFFMGWDTVSKLRPVGVFVNFRNMSPSVSLTWGLWTQGNVKAAHCVMYV